jgi:hypothetical protein
MDKHPAMSAAAMIDAANIRHSKHLLPVTEVFLGVTLAGSKT